MRLGRTIKRSVLIGAASVLVVVAVLYIQAARLPSLYCPAELTQARRQEVKEDFYKQIQDFHNKAQDIRPYTVSFSQRRLNEYFSSMDEIAAAQPFSRTKAGDVHKAMARMGLSDPAVALGDNVVTLMVRSTRHDKVVSADVSLELVSPGKVQVRLLGTRVGRLGVPTSAFRGLLSKLKRSVRAGLRDAEDDQADDSADGLEGPSSTDVARALATLIAAIDEGPISTEFKWGKRVCIEGIDITPGVMTLHVQPMGREPHHGG